MKTFIVFLLIFQSKLSLSLTMEDRDFIFENYGFEVGKEGFKTNNNNDDDCSDSPNFVNELYGETLPKKCEEEFSSRSEKQKYCNCLREGISSNFLVQDIIKASNNDYSQMQDEIKKDYLKKFASAYSQLTIGETVQNIILGNKQQNPTVTCSPQDLSFNIKDQKEKYLANFEQILSNKKVDLEAELKDQKCEGKLSKRKTRICSQISSELDKVKTALTKESLDKKRNDVVEKINRPNCFTDKIISDLKESLSSQKLKYEENLLKEPSNKQFKDNLVKINYHLSQISQAESQRKESSSQAVQSFSWTPSSAYSIDKLKLNEKNIQPIESSGLPDQVQDMSLGSPNCLLENSSSSSIYLAATNFNEQLESFDLEAADGPASAKCDGDPVCINFKNWNEEISSEFKDRFSEKPEVQCVTFAEYKLLKSLPSSDFIKKLSKEVDPVSFLNPADSKFQTEKLKFLRGNPILAKFVQNPSADLKNSLNVLLKDLSKNLSSAKSEPEKLKIYLDFLKGNKDANSLQSLAKTNSKKLQDANICTDLARNYMAIQVADYLPEDGSESSKNLSVALSRELIMCERSSKPTDESEILKTLQRDPVFTLGDPDEDKTIDQELAEFNDFLQKTCHANGLSYQDFIKTKCKKPFEQCRQDFLNQSIFQSYNQTLNGAGVKPGLSNVSPSEILHNTNSNNQDLDFMSFYQNEVLPHYNKDPLATFGLKNYFESKESQQSFISNIQFPSQLNSMPSSPKLNDVDNTSSPSHLSSKERTTISNPGQVQPRFNMPTQSNQAMANSGTSSRQPASLGTDSLRDNTNVRKPNIRPNSNDKWSSGAQSPQYTNSQDTKLGKAEIDKLADDNSKLKDLNTSMANKEAKESSVGSSQGSTVSGSVASSGSIAAGSQSSFSMGGGSKSVALGESPEKKGNFNDALNNIHEKSSLTVLGGVIDPAEFIGPQQSAKDLIVDDPKKFEKLGEDPALLEAFIKEKMKGMAIGESKIITIINASPNRPVPHMIFRIKAKADGSFDIQSVPSEVPVRVATLKSLIDQLPKR